MAPAPDARFVVGGKAREGELRAKRKKKKNSTGAPKKFRVRVL
jgi:hypothetical protein